MNRRRPVRRHWRRPGQQYTVGVSLASTASITPKALTVTGMSVSAKAYDGNTKASLTGGTLNGLVVGETVNFSGQAGVFADQNAGTGKSVTVTGINVEQCRQPVSKKLASFGGIQFNTALKPRRKFFYI